MSGKGSVSITPLMPLSYVLHVPNLSNSLRSVSNLTKQLNYCVIFFPTHCVFQDRVTRKTIGSGKKRDDLYFLDSQGLPDGPVQQAHQSMTCATSKEQLWLLHRQLDHPSFLLLQKKFSFFVFSIRYF